MKTTNILRTLSFSSLVLMISACARPSVEFVETDPSYTLDKNYISVEMPKPSTYNPHNIVMVNGDIEATLVANVEDGVGSMEDTKVPVSFRLRRALKEDLTLIIKENRELLSNYTGEQLGYHPFPEGVLKEFKVVVPAGKTHFEATFELSNVSKFNEAPGYLTAFQISTAEGVTDVEVSPKNSTLFLKVNISSLIPGQNTTLSPRNIDDEPIEITSITSNFRNDMVNGLKDGRLWGSQWWVQAHSDTYLELKFDKNFIKGLGFVCYPGYKGKSIKSVKIEVSEDGGASYVYQGTVQVPDARSKIYILFNHPVAIDAIRISDFDTHSNDPSDQYVDMAEVMVFEDYQDDQD